MMKFYINSLVIFSLLLAGCSIYIPVKGISNDGTKWDGYFTASEFQIFGGGVICYGKPNLGLGKVNTHNFKCDDGRTGEAITTRTHSGGGKGKVIFSDGKSAEITYGN